MSSPGLCQRLWYTEKSEFCHGQEGVPFQTGCCWSMKHLLQTVWSKLLVTSWGCGYARLWNLRKLSFTRKGVL